MSNAIWDLLLGTEEDAKRIAGSVLSTAAVRLQTEYMGTWRTKITVHGVPVDICEDRLGDIFSKYGQVEEVSAITTKSGIATGDVMLHVTLARQTFGKVPNILMGRKKRMLVVVERRRPYC